MLLLKYTAPFLFRLQTRGATGKRLSSAALLVEAFWQLVRFDLLLRRGDFAKVYQTVRKTSPNEARCNPGTVTEVCTAIDRASVWYWKQILCLQRSAATACLLKSLGVPAVLVIGVQTLPVKAHAWVEVGGFVVGEKPYMREMYEVLDCC